MAQKVTVLYRGARWELGRGLGFYGIWAAGADGRQHPPVEWWPETADGWQHAWARLTTIEAPDAIAQVGQASQGGPAGPDPALADIGPRRALIATTLLGLGVACGIAGLFPRYLNGSSLAASAVELVPHVAYLAVWAASALLIWRGGSWRRAGTLLGLGTSIVTFGFFLADAGPAIADGAHLVGAGLVLGLIGWLACTAGAAAAFEPRATGTPARPRVHQSGLVLTLMFAGFAAVGAAITFAPSWDSYTLRTAIGVTQTTTAGNAFANPGPVIAGNVAVMVTLAVVAVIAALWRPARLGAALLAGATIPMLAQAISAIIQIAGGTSPEQLGISPAQAAAAGLTISSGLTAPFWLFCAFVVALAATCYRMLMPITRPTWSRPGPAGTAATPGATAATLGATAATPGAAPAPDTGTQEPPDATAQAAQAPSSASATPGPNA